MPRAQMALCFLVFLTATGCRQKPLQYEKSKTLDSGETWAITLDPPIREQKISVDAEASGAPIDVWVILEDDPNKAKDLGSKALVEHQPIAGALASQQKTEKATLEATIPANKGFSIVVNNPGQLKKAEVKLKVTGK